MLITNHIRKIVSIMYKSKSVEVQTRNVVQMKYSKSVECIYEKYEHNSQRLKNEHIMENRIFVDKVDNMDENDDILSMSSSDSNTAELSEHLLICEQCNQHTPPLQAPDNQADWIFCEDHRAWFHMFCVDVDEKVLLRYQGIDWNCAKCQNQKINYQDDGSIVSDESRSVSMSISSFSEPEYSSGESYHISDDDDF